MSHLLIVKYRDADEPIEATGDEHTMLTMARNLNDTFTEWAEVLDEDGTIVWDNVNGDV